MPTLGLHTPVTIYGNRSRLGNTPGGPVDSHPRANPAPGQVNDRLRAPNNTMESTLQRERMPWIPVPQMTPPADGGYLDWTRSGPIRPSLHMRDVTINRMQGTDNTRALDPVPTGYGIQDGNGSSMSRQLVNVPVNNKPHGLHTRYPAQGSGTAFKRMTMTPQMRPGRQNRLFPSPYVGQSYSQTTSVQGG